MDMIERVARKLCKLEYPNQSEGWYELSWSEFTDNGRAVIAVMREPTEAMVQAADGVELAPWTSGWTAMIDAALATPNPAKDLAIAHDSGTEYDWQVMLDPAVAESARI